MKEFNATDVRIETASALNVVRDGLQSDFYSFYVGLDVHKETIAIAVARPGRIPANVTGHSGDRDRFAHGHHAGVGFVL
jgi:hypothetical protein